MVTRLACPLFAALSLAACAPMLALVGTYTTLVQVVAQIVRVKLAGDGASYVASSKTITDHALSMVTGDECKSFNVLTHESVCVTKSTDPAGDAVVKVSPGPASEPILQAQVQPIPEIAAAPFYSPHEQLAGN